MNETVYLRLKTRNVFEICPGRFFTKNRLHLRKTPTKNGKHRPNKNCAYIVAKAPEKIQIRYLEAVVLFGLMSDEFGVSHNLVSHRWKAFRVNEIKSRRILINFCSSVVIRVVFYHSLIWFVPKSDRFIIDPPELIAFQPTNMHFGDLDSHKYWRNVFFVFNILVSAFERKGPPMAIVFLRPTNWHISKSTFL